MHSHLYDDDNTISMGTKLWFFDVVDGRIALLPEQTDDFLYLLEERGERRFYDSDTEAFIIEFQRLQGLFSFMLDEIADDE